MQDQRQNDLGSPKKLHDQMQNDLGSPKKSEKQEFSDYADLSHEAERQYEN